MAKEWTLKLNNGRTIPAFGLGTWQSKPGEVGAAVEVALKNGYRHIDCAQAYFNEGEVGEALQKCFKEGVCKREDVFITSKIWSTDHEKERVLPAIQLTLKNLQLDYLDLYLIHGPNSFRPGASFPNVAEEDKLGYDEGRIARCWEAMEDLVQRGLTRAIGISNFSITKTEKLLKTAKIVPAANQVELHAYFQQPKLREYCDSKGILVEAYSPLGSPGRPGVIESDPVVMEDPVINEIATKKGATAAQICISFLLHRGFVVIPKSVTPKRIIENQKSTEVTLDEDEIKQLVGIDKNHRLFTAVTRFMPKGVTLEQVFDIEEDEKFVIKKE